MDLEERLNLEDGEAAEVPIDLEEWEDGKMKNVQKEASRKGAKQCWDERLRPKAIVIDKTMQQGKGKVREKEGEHYEQLSSSKYISSDMMLEQSSAKFQHCFPKPDKRKAQGENALVILKNTWNINEILFAIK